MRGHSYSSISCGRYLEHKGYDVNYVQNVTDVDDRSIDRGAETGEDWRAIVRGYYRRSSVDAPSGRDGARRGTHATAFMPQIQTMIRELHREGQRVCGRGRHLLSTCAAFRATVSSAM